MKKERYIEAVLKELLEGEKTTSQLIEALQRVEPTLSYHSGETIVLQIMKELEDLGITVSERKRVRIFQLTPAGAWVLYFSLTLLEKSEIEKSDVLFFIARKVMERYPVIRGFKILSDIGLFTDPLEGEKEVSIRSALVKAKNILSEIIALPLTWEDAANLPIKLVGLSLFFIEEDEVDEFIKRITTLSPRDIYDVADLLREAIQTCDERIEKLKRIWMKILSALPS